MNKRKKGSLFASFFELEATSGILLFLAALAAIATANSSWRGYYDAFLAFPVSFTLGPVEFSKSMLVFINDALMALFFLLVGAEIKREILDGELSTLSKAMLPIVSALGGMIVPAIIFLFFNLGNGTEHGWAIPAATDIAFSLGVLSLFGSRVPLSIKVFLSALAIADDLGAILVIAFFYSDSLALGYLSWALLPCLALLILNQLGVKTISLYCVVGIVLWYCVLKSGVHPTIAGVLLASAIPLNSNRGGTHDAPIHRLEKALHPWVAFFILPLFAFANAGILISDLGFSTLLQPVSLGAMLGLFVGKPLGIGLFSLALIRSGWAPIPKDASIAHILGAAFLAGIGFTMSLFIAMLAFPPGQLFATARVGIFAGSIASALVGAALLSTALAKKR